MSTSENFGIFSQGRVADMDSVRVTKDPTTAHCRIYVGGLNEDISRYDIENYFKRFGRVLAITVLGGYGFVQFCTEEEAQDALRDGGSKLLKGYHLTLKTAVKNKMPNGREGGGPPGGPMGPMGRGRPMPPRHGDGPPRHGDGPPRHGDGPPDMKRPRGPPRDGRDWSPPPPAGPRRPRRPFEYEEEEEERFDPYRRFRGGPPGDRFDEGGRRGPGGRPPGPGGPGGPGGPPPYMQRPRSAAVEEERSNDCEIVVLDRKNRPYAEEVEDRLKNIGLAVDMLFPRAGAPINQVLDQIVSRGTLYAVVVHPTNEQHRSVSLNIMHGNPPQEHRNMPLDDAMSLVARNFEAYMLSNKDKAPPQGIINLLDFVRENRPLTAVEYNRLIRYLEEKRDHQLKPDKTGLVSLTSSMGSVAPKPVPAPVVSVATASQQQMDLQQKILNMMQAYKTQTTVAVASAPAAVPVPAPVLPPAGVQTWAGGEQPGGAAATGPVMSQVKCAADSLATSGPNVLKMEDGQQHQQQQQQQQYGEGYGYSTQTSSLGRAPANPLFGAYASQGY